MPTETLTNVPSDQVGEVVQSFVQNGARRVTAVQTTPGFWTITAELP